MDLHSISIRCSLTTQPIPTDVVKKKRLYAFKTFNVIFDGNEKCEYVMNSVKIFGWWLAGYFSCQSDHLWQKLELWDVIIV